MIKVAHITNYYHKKSGGISTSFNALMAAAERHRREMVLIVPGEEDGVEQVNDFARIYYLKAPKSFLFDKRYRVLLPWTYMLDQSPIRKILLKEMPDMIEITDKYTLSMFGGMIKRGFLKKLNRPPLIHFSCERMDDNIGSFLTGGRIGRRFARAVIGYYTLPSFDYHIANSPYTAAEFTESVDPNEKPSRMRGFLNTCWRFFRAPRVPLSERVFVCPRGVNAEQYSPDRKNPDTRKELLEIADGDEKTKLLLYAGRISPEKNIELLVDMMKDLSRLQTEDFVLLIAGAGPKKEWLKKVAAREFPGKVKFLGHLDKETLANYYANIDVFVHPNPREPFGIGPLEAMASGAPCVVPNGGGLLFYATKENCWLAEPNGSDFADAVRECIDNPELRAKKVGKGFEAVRNNTRVQSTDFLLETYDRIWEDFQAKKELFTDNDASKEFNYNELRLLSS